MMVAGSTILLLHGHSIINPWGGGWSCLLLWYARGGRAAAVGGWWVVGWTLWTVDGFITSATEKIDHDHEDEISNTNW